MAIGIHTVLFASIKVFRLVSINHTDGSAVTIIIVLSFYTEHLMLKLYAIIKR
jgi:hypothetical protein